MMGGLFGCFLEVAQELMCAVTETSPCSYPPQRGGWLLHWKWSFVRVVAVVLGTIPLPDMLLHNNGGLTYDPMTSIFDYIKLYLFFVGVNSCGYICALMKQLSSESQSIINFLSKTYTYPEFLNVFLN
jgi:hypothetical protein